MTTQWTLLNLFMNIGNICPHFLRGKFVHHIYLLFFFHFYFMFIIIIACKPFFFSHHSTPIISSTFMYCHLLINFSFLLIFNHVPMLHWNELMMMVVVHGNNSNKSSKLSLLRIEIKLASNKFLSKSLW